MKTKTQSSIVIHQVILVICLFFAGVRSAQAASQTWSNAPTSSAWATAANWNANAVPGALNQTGNSVNNDVATFNTPLAGGTIGGAGNPILTDDATTIGTRSRTAGSIVFDTINC